MRGPRDGAKAKGSSPDELVAEVEAKNALERAVLDLDEPYRSVLLWRYYEDVSIEEISRPQRHAPVDDAHEDRARAGAIARSDELGAGPRMAHGAGTAPPAEARREDPRRRGRRLRSDAHDVFGMLGGIIAATTAAALIALLANLHDPGSALQDRADLSVRRVEGAELADMDTLVGPGVLEPAARTEAAALRPDPAATPAAPVASFDSRLRDRESGSRSPASSSTSASRTRSMRSS